jgi:hypothetical protein
MRGTLLFRCLFLELVHCIIMEIGNSRAVLFFLVLSTTILFRNPTRLASLVLLTQVFG